MRQSIPSHLRLLTSYDAQSLALLQIFEVNLCPSSSLLIEYLILQMSLYTQQVCRHLSLHDGLADQELALSHPGWQQRFPQERHDLPQSDPSP